MKKSLVISSTAQMAQCASEIASQVRPGDLILLEGPLGAGKTFFAQALIHSLGVTEHVTSPTFVMMKSYRGRYFINHIDAYRLIDLPDPGQAFDELDVDIEESLTIVEWGAKFDVTGNALLISIEIGDGESRNLTFVGPDARWGGLTI